MLTRQVATSCGCQSSLARTPLESLRELDLHQRHIPWEGYCPVCRGRGQNDKAQICPACLGYGHFNGLRRLSDENNFQALRDAGFLDDFLKTSISVTETDFGNIQLFDSSDRTLRIIRHSGFNEEFLDFFRIVRGTGCGCGAALSRMSRVVVPDVSSDPIFQHQRSQEVMLRANSYACQSTPLVDSSGRLLGMISTHCRQPREFSDRELQDLDLVTEYFVAKMEKRLRM